ncbi:MAG TPA: translation elongation factor Ts [Candidatus Woesebacteria bacterium]|jgi:elongation factor Ts|nr:translation elongation factor Ts [Candidatus Shapirobacteria bacterium]HOR02026.1 translation elongation factor Ts [Candidatus Woesebacteria bacterium]
MDNKKIIELVKKLRKEMGLGIMEIKAAVEEAEGDEVKAKQILKEKGFKKAETKSERETHQGRVATYTHSTGKIGVMVELLCETDFVAKHEDFVELTKNLCLQVAAMNPETVEDLLKQEFIKDSSKTVEEMIKSLVAKFGENMKLSRFSRFEI